VTEDIAREIMEHAERKGDALSRGARDFVEWVTGKDVPSHMVG
jgi:hypothetical protein